MSAKISDERKAYNNKWTNDHFKRLSVVVPNEDRVLIQEHIEKRGETLGQFVRRAISETMERDNAGTE